MQLGDTIRMFLEAGYSLSAQSSDGLPRIALPCVPNESDNTSQNEFNASESNNTSENESVETDCSGSTQHAHMCK